MHSERHLFEGHLSTTKDQVGKSKASFPRSITPLLVFGLALVIVMTATAAPALAGSSPGEREVLKSLSSTLNGTDSDGDAVTDWAEANYWQGEYRQELIPLKLPSCDQDAFVVDTGYTCSSSGGCDWSTALAATGRPLLDEIEASRAVCFEPGDYTSLGVLTISRPNFETRVLRFSEWLGSARNPINLTKADRATLLALSIKPDYNGDEPMDFVVSGLAFSGLPWIQNGTKGLPLVNIDDANNMRPIFDRVLLEDATVRGMLIQHADNGSVVQRSVFHRSWPGVVTAESLPNEGTTEDRPCLTISVPSRDARILNNEFADCVGDAIIIPYAGADYANLSPDHGDPTKTDWKTGHLGLTISGNDFLHTGFLGAWVDWDDGDTKRKLRTGAWLNADAALDWAASGGSDPLPAWQPGNAQCSENAIDIKSIMPMEYYDMFLDGFRTDKFRAVKNFQFLAERYYRGGIPLGAFDPDLNYPLDPSAPYVDPAVYKIWVDDYVRAKAQAIEAIEVPEYYRAWIVGNRFHGTQGGTSADCRETGAIPEEDLTGPEGYDGSPWSTIVVHFSNSDYIRVAENIAFGSPMYFYISFIKPQQIPLPLSIYLDCEEKVDEMCQQTEEDIDSFFFNPVSYPDHHEIVENIIVDTTWEEAEFKTVHMGAFNVELTHNVFRNVDLWSYWTSGSPQTLTCNIVEDSQERPIRTADPETRSALDVKDNIYVDSTSLVDRDIIYECELVDSDGDPYHKHDRTDCKPFLEPSVSPLVGDLTFDFPLWTTAWQQSVTLERVVPSTQISEACPFWDNQD